MLKAFANMSLPQVRLLPVVILAALALLFLKLGALVLPDNDQQFAGPQIVLAQEEGEDGEDVDPDLGELSEDRPEAVEVEGGDAVEEVAGVRSAADAIAERLSERRQQIEQREGELTMRENLLRAAEKRIEERISELKSLEQQLNAAIEKRDEVEARRFDNLVAMYSNMKPKDAARVFNELETRVLVEVASEIDPRQMGEILADMNSDAARRLTLALISKAAQRDSEREVPSELPQIIGSEPAG